MKTQADTLKVYYDGACHLCSREVETYLKADHNNKIKAIDISSPNFDAAFEGLDEKRANKYFHVKNTKGEVIEGVEAFAAIWETLNIFKPLRWFYKTRFGKITMGASYKVFAEVRPFLPKRKDCSTCKI
jgi:predicted DCC family thiol-disulfide oxidoreductase YuxK